MRTAYRSWTVDEASGLVAEFVGMIAPVELWAEATTADQLGRWTRNAPNGRGDCFWIEALVQAIESRGTLRWIDVRRANPRLDQAHGSPVPPFALNARWRSANLEPAGQSDSRRLRGNDFSAARRPTR